MGDEMTTTHASDPPSKYFDRTKCGLYGKRALRRHLIEEEIALANLCTHTPEELADEDRIHPWKVPVHEDWVGWRGPAELVPLNGGKAIVKRGAEAKETLAELIRPHNPLAFWFGT